MTTTYFRDYRIGRDYWIEQLGNVFNIYSDTLDNTFDTFYNKVNNSLPGSYQWLPLSSEIIGDVKESEEIELNEILEIIETVVNELNEDEEFLKSIHPEAFEL